jgi:hypothetical protein
MLPREYAQHMKFSLQISPLFVCVLGVSATIHVVCVIGSFWGYGKKVLPRFNGGDGFKTM